MHNSTPKTFFDRTVGNLFDIGSVKTTEITLKSGSVTPVYFDLRVAVSHPDALVMICHLLWERTNGLKFDLICGVPYTALPFASYLSVKQKVPMVMRRKEAKAYGTKNMIEGNYKPEQRCLVIEDIVTSGSSVFETVQDLKKSGLIVTDVVVLLDREQGGHENLLKQGIQMHSVCTATGLLASLLKQKKIETEIIEKYKSYIAENQASPLHCMNVSNPTPRESFGERSKLCSHPLAKELFNLMEEKQTNLCVAADVTTKKELLALADAVGPHICLLKTHMDIIKDFDGSVVLKLKALAKKHKFLLFEDRKFADIGKIVQLQYTSGILNISSWADLIDTHALPGPGVVEALKEASSTTKNGCLLIAQMSSKDNLLTTDYTKMAVKQAEMHSDFVIGFISQSQVTTNPTLLHVVPGVKFEDGSDGEDLDQQYSTPADAVLHRGADIIVVGRGITKDSQPGKAANEYKLAGFEAYSSQVPSVENVVEEENNIEEKTELETNDS